MENKEYDNEESIVYSSIGENTIDQESHYEDSGFEGYDSSENLYYNSEDESECDLETVLAKNAVADGTKLIKKSKINKMIERKKGNTIEVYEPITVNSLITLMCDNRYKKNKWKVMDASYSISNSIIALTTNFSEELNKLFAVFIKDNNDIFALNSIFEPKISKPCTYKFYDTLFPLALLARLIVNGYYVQTIMQGRISDVVFVPFNSSNSLIYKTRCEELAKIVKFDDIDKYLLMFKEEQPSRFKRLSFEVENFLELKETIYNNEIYFRVPIVRDTGIQFYLVKKSVMEFFKGIINSYIDTASKNFEEYSIRQKFANLYLPEYVYRFIERCLLNSLTKPSLINYSRETNTVAEYFIGSLSTSAMSFLEKCISTRILIYEYSKVYYSFPSFILRKIVLNNNLIKDPHTYKQSKYLVCKTFDFFFDKGFDMLYNTSNKLFQIIYPIMKEEKFLNKLKSIPQYRIKSELFYLADKYSKIRSGNIGFTTYHAMMDHFSMKQLENKNYLLLLKKMYSLEGNLRDNNGFYPVFYLMGNRHEITNSNIPLNYNYPFFIHRNNDGFDFFEDIFGDDDFFVSNEPNDIKCYGNRTIEKVEGLKGSEYRDIKKMLLDHSDDVSNYRNNSLMHLACNANRFKWIKKHITISELQKLDLNKKNAIVYIIENAGRNEKDILLLFINNFIKKNIPKPIRKKLLKLAIIDNVYWENRVAVSIMEKCGFFRGFEFICPCEF